LLNDPLERKKRIKEKMIGEEEEAKMFVPGCCSMGCWPTPID
jgi:hypothetical protein